MNRPITITPGNTPAINSRAMQRSAATPYTIRMMDGGLSRPQLAEPATVPRLSFSSPPRALSSGTATLATVAQVAADEPLTAANSPDARTPTCPRPPGKERIQGAKPENRSLDMRERNKISPIQINKGKAAKDHSAEVLHILVASTLSSGALENSTMPTRPVTNSAIETQRPSARLPISTATKIKDITASDITALPRLRFLCVALHCDPGAACRP